VCVSDVCAILQQVGELRAHVVGRERETKLIRATLADVDAEVYTALLSLYNTVYITATATATATTQLRSALVPRCAAQ
jgi:hypothetical protein